MKQLRLDRIAVEDGGANPRRLAKAIHRQVGDFSGPVPVHAIARALDIDEIREEPLTSFEAALLTTAERSYGSILVNLNSSPQRRRFSVGHELCHFLNPLHVPTSPRGFQCKGVDMIASKPGSTDRHVRQEAQANEFAIELLAPRRLLRNFLNGGPTLHKVLQIALDLDISREAAARRYVELHDDELAVVFGKQGRFNYASCSAEFPTLRFRKGDPIPVVAGRRDGQVSGSENVDPDDWLYRSQGCQLTAQPLHQQNDFSTTLLCMSPTDDDTGLDDTYDRFSRFTDGR